MRQLRAYSVFILKDRLSVNKVIIYADGASRGNPGPAAIGAIIKDEKGNPITQISRCIGITTNNQAEYQAIIAALEKALGLGAKQVELKSDSELVVKQINGRYKVKKAVLRPLYQRIVQLIGSLEGFTIAYIPRQQNQEADNLANEALNGMK
jgi:ribonuclease HI